MGAAAKTDCRCPLASDLTSGGHARSGDGLSELALLQTPQDTCEFEASGARVQVAVEVGDLRRAKLPRLNLGKYVLVGTGHRVTCRQYKSKTPCIGEQERVWRERQVGLLCARRRARIRMC